MMSGINKKAGYVLGFLFLLFVVGSQVKAEEMKSTATLQQTTCYTELREAPDADSAVIGELDEGTAVIVEGTEGSWSMVRYKEQSGYIPNEALDVYDAGQLEELNQEFQQVGENNVRIVDEYELAQKEKRSSVIWGAVIAVLVAGIFAVGIISALKANKQGEQ